MFICSSSNFQLFVTEVVMLFFDDPHACQLISDYLQCSMSGKRFACQCILSL